MNSNDVITFKITDTNIQDKLIRKAIDYAIISIPFTYDRLGNRNLTKNILNIAKGKIAENYFYNFCSEKRIQLDTESLTTPFYQADKKDFVYNQLEWDLKNNFLIHDQDLLPNDIYLEQIALIPNRGPWDQWSKRNYLNRHDSLGSGYIFTFMKKAETDSSSEFLTIKMSLNQKNFLLDLYENYKGKHQNISPYNSEKFWNEFHDRGSRYEFEISHFPWLVITGVALKEDFIHFRTFKPSDMTSPYLRTIIENMGTRVAELRSFKEYIGL